MPSIPKAHLFGLDLTTGQKSCCHATFDQAIIGKRLHDDLCCANPSRAFLVVCVSCPQEVSAQHGCSNCCKVVCNFCRGFDDANTLCYVCKHGKQRPESGGTQVEEPNIPSTSGAHFTRALRAFGYNLVRKPKEPPIVLSVEFPLLLCVCVSRNFEVFRV